MQESPAIKAARKKLDAIGWAIAYQLKDRKAAPVHPAYAAPVERTRCAWTLRAAPTPNL